MNRKKSNGTTKQKVTSVRMTEEQHKKIQELAASEHQTASQYMLNAALNRDKVITPDFLVEFQNVLNPLYREIQKYNPNLLEVSEGMVNELWQKFV